MMMHILVIDMPWPSLPTITLCFAQLTLTVYAHSNQELSVYAYINLDQHIIKSPKHHKTYFYGSRAAGKPINIKASHLHKP